MMRFPTFDGFDLKVLLKNQYLPWIVNFLLLCCIGWQLWQIVIFFKQSPVPQIEVVMPPPVQAEQKQPDIARMHLFGLSAVEQAPQTRLKFLLKSTFQAAQDVNSRALIEINGSTQDYRIGDLLPGGAVIDSILSDRVLIRNYGNVEVLLLPRSFPNLDQRFGN